MKELARENITSLLVLKYDTVEDGVSILGSTVIAKETFAGFQKYLYFE